MRLTRKFAPLGLIAALLLFSLFHSRPSGAAGGGSSTAFGVSPPGFDLKGAPGEQISAVMKIENLANRPSRYSLTPMGFVMSGKNIVEREVGSLPADNIARNVTFESPTVTVPARSSKTVNVFIRIPMVAKGTQYTGVNVSRSAEVAEPTERSTEYERHLGMGMSPAIGVKIRVSITGEMNYAYKLGGMKVLPATATQPPSLIATVQNSGNGELKINPVVVLVDSAGKAGMRMKATEPVTLTPGSQMDVKFMYSGPRIPGGSYKAIFTIPDPGYKLAPTETSIVIK